MKSVNIENVVVGDIIGYSTFAPFDKVTLRGYAKLIKIQGNHYYGYWSDKLNDVEEYWKNEKNYGFIDKCNLVYHKKRKVTNWKKRINVNEMSPWMIYHCTRICKSLDDALEYIKKHF